MKKIPSMVVMLLLTCTGVPCYADSLLQVYRQVLQNNPELREAAADQDKATAELDISRSTLLPQLSLHASQGRARQEDRAPFHSIPQGGMAQLGGIQAPVVFPDKQIGGYNKHYLDTGNLDVTLSQSLFELPKWYQVGISKSSVQLKEIGYQNTQQLLLLRTVDCYLKTLLALDKLESVIVEKRARSRKLHEIGQMTQVGVLPATDYYRAKSEYDLSVALEIRQRNMMISQLEQLRELSGGAPEKLMALNGKAFKPVLPMGNVEEWVKQGEQKNWELQGARMKQEIALTSLRGQQFCHLPTLNIQAKLEHQRNVQQSEVAKRRSISGGLSLSLPLFSGGQITAKVRESQANVLLASEQLERIQRKVVREIREYYNGIQETISSAQAYREALLSAQRELEAMEASFKAGTVTFVEVINARSKLFAARQGLTEAQYNYFNCVLKLKSCCGELNEKDLVELEKPFTVAVSVDPKMIRWTADSPEIDSLKKISGHSLPIR